MLVSASFQVTYPEIHTFEKSVLETVEAFCWVAASNSSPYMRHAYARYAMTSEELEEKMAVFAAKVRQHACPPMEAILEMLLDPLVNLISIFDPDWSDVRNSGRILQHASYAGCLLGAPATYGDLAFEFKMLQYTYRRKEKQEEISPKAVFEAYQCGDRVLMSFYLNEKLKKASRALGKVRLIEGQRNIVRHAPSIWRVGKDGYLTAESKVLDTKYHLYFSLANFVEKTAGNA